MNSRTSQSLGPLGYLAPLYLEIFLKNNTVITNLETDQRSHHLDEFWTRHHRRQGNSNVLNFWTRGKAKLGTIKFAMKRSLSSSIKHIPSHSKEIVINTSVKWTDLF